MHSFLKKVCTHIYTRGAPQYLFLWWIVSEAERLHGDGSPQIGTRKSEERRRRGESATAVHLLTHIYDDVFSHRRLMHRTPSSLPPFSPSLMLLCHFHSYSFLVRFLYIS